MSESVVIAREIGDLVRQLCIALTNVESFSANHPLAKKHVSSAYESMAALLRRQKEPLIISVSNKCVLFDGMPLEDRNPLVGKFAARLEDIHAHHLAFDPAISAEEFQTFYSVLGKGSKFINEHGGFSALMESANIMHVKVRKIDYVMVNEGEKVVSKSATVVEPSADAPLNSDTGIIASDADQTRAREVTDEFIRCERSLQKTEQLLRKLTPASETAESFLGRIRQHLLQGGMTPDELAQLETNLKKEPEPKAPKKPRKRASDFVTQGIAKRLKEFIVDSLQLQEVVASLSSFIEARACERAGEIQLEAGRLREELTHRDTALQNLPWGVILWNAQGKVELVNPAAAQVLGTETGIELTVPLKVLLKEKTFPLMDLAGLNPTRLSAVEMKLLRSTSVVLKNETGDIVGVVLANANG